jgi:hypothetical protein
MLLSSFRNVAKFVPQMAYLRHLRQPKTRYKIKDKLGTNKLTNIQVKIMVKITAQKLCENTSLSAVHYGNF